MEESKILVQYSAYFCRYCRFRDPTPRWLFAKFSILGYWLLNIS